MFDLAGTYHKQRKFEQAEQLIIEVLNARTKTLGSEHPETLLALHNLVVIYVTGGTTEDIVQLAMELLERETRVFGSTHEYTQRSAKLFDSLF
jgi:hypothetical protein